MTESNAFDFTKFVPGFEFLKNLTPHAPATSTGAPGWVAPTLDPKEIDKRIQELKTVQFWLELQSLQIADSFRGSRVKWLSTVNSQDFAGNCRTHLFTSTHQNRSTETEGGILVALSSKTSD